MRVQKGNPLPPVRRISLFLAVATASTLYSFLLLCPPAFADCRNCATSENSSASGGGVGPVWLRIRRLIRDRGRPLGGSDGGFGDGSFVSSDSSGLGGAAPMDEAPSGPGDGDPVGRAAVKQKLETPEWEWATSREVH